MSGTQDQFFLTPRGVEGGVSKSNILSVLPMSKNSILCVLLATVLNDLACGQEARVAISEPGGQVSSIRRRGRHAGICLARKRISQDQFQSQHRRLGTAAISLGRAWLHISVDEDKVEKEVPDQGILLEYTFQSPKTARYEVWNRVGFEFVRSPFEWRIDEGAVEDRRRRTT